MRIPTLLKLAVLIAIVFAIRTGCAQNVEHGQPARVRAAERFLRRRGVVARDDKHTLDRKHTRDGNDAPDDKKPIGDKLPFNNGALVAPVWTAVGPLGVVSAGYGVVTGRVSAVAFDPSDATGNHVFLGTTGGGLWSSQNAAAATAASVVFTPLTDGLGALSQVLDSGISVGAVSVQPGGTGVVLAGLGDPNDALDSYYGAGLLRSADGGATWTLIEHSLDLESGASTQDYWFVGEGFAGFAWSSTNAQLVVAAVSQAYEGTLVNALAPGSSYEGLYYSTDAGLSWHLAEITDQSGQDVQGPGDGFVLPDGNAATSVVWNPVRQVFVAAVRFHGYYTSADGAHWTQLPLYPGGQPGMGFTAGNCPTNAGSVGVAGCPIFRGTLAVNPLSGDTFAWSVDEFNQDQGIWQDQCGINAGVCANQAIAFGTQLNTAALETSDENGPATIENGDYNLALAAVPGGLFQGEDTLVFAGANDLWKCSLANSCVWRNTTNSGTCMSAGVAPYQHGLAWGGGNPELIFVGNDSGLWRSTDQVGEIGAVCSGGDATHFQNLNGSLGSLAEVDSLTESKSNEATMLAGLGANGFAGIVNGSTTVGDWNQVLGGEGGPVAIDPTVAANSWYANAGAGVEILHCLAGTGSGGCNPAGFGNGPVVGETQVDGDGLTMPYPAVFRLDAEDPTQIVVGTCRVWRGPVSGLGWSVTNLISPTLDGAGGEVGDDCDGDGLIGTIAVQKTAGGEVMYVGMAGAANGGGTVAGHVFTTTIGASGAVGSWTDLTYGPVVNDELGFNAFGAEVSNLYIDPHDGSGMTVYATISAFASVDAPLQQVYRTTDGGSHWTAIRANLPDSPANAVVVDTQDPNTVYVGMDVGVYVTRAVASCGTGGVGGGSACWAAYGTGLPESPVTQLLVGAPGATGPDGGQALTAGTYGRGIWEIPMATAGTVVTTASVSPGSLVFGSTTVGMTSGTQTVTLKNTGSATMAVGTVAVEEAEGAVGTSLDFSETDNCAGSSFGKGSSCAIKVSFDPAAAGSRSGVLAIAVNVTGGQVQVPLSGTGLTAANVTLLPTSLNFTGQNAGQQVGTTSAGQSFSVQNVGGSGVSISSIGVSGPFLKTGSTCGSTLAGGSACAVTVAFKPAAAGLATGSLTVVDGEGTQSAALSGTGIVGPTDTLSTTSLTFAPTVVGQVASPLAVTITNTGGLPLTSIGTSVSVSAGGAEDFWAVSDCGSQLAAGASCGVTVQFAPSFAKGESGQLTISDSLRSQTVQLSGRGLAPPLISLYPGSLGFGPQQVNTSSGALTVTISNKGGSPLARPGFAISGVGAGSFSVANTVGSTACGVSVAAGGSCEIAVTFTPLYSGLATGTLTVTTSSPGVAGASIGLSGKGLTPPTLEVSPAALDMGPVLLGNSSALFDVQVSNEGQEPMAEPTFAVSGAEAGDFALSPPTDIAACGGVLNPGGGCNVQVTFSPSVLGLESATLTVTSVDAVPPTATVSLTGTGMPVTVLEADPAMLSFAATAVGLTSSPLTLKVNNMGKKTANNLTLTLTGAYQLAPAVTSCGTKLLGNSFCTVGVEFSPVAAGDEPGTLTVQVSNKGVVPLTIPLDGSGVAVGGLEPSPTQLTFGSVIIQTASAAQSLTITNSGQAEIDGLGIEVNGDFGLQSNGCSTTLSAPVCSQGVCVASSCTTGVVFTPSMTGTRLGTLTVSSTSSGVMPAVVSLSGSGSPPGSLTESPSVVNFGPVTVGQTSPVQTVSLSNTNGLGMALAGVSLVVRGDYSVVQNTCGTAIAVGGVCSFGVEFSPTLTGTRIGSVTVMSTTTGYTPVVTGLEGTGVPGAELTVTPGTLNFGMVETGTNSGALALTIGNPGSKTLSGILVTALSPFSVGTGNCGSSLGAGSSCMVPVIFSPSSGGLSSGVVTISSASVGVAGVKVPVTGTGVVAPSLTLSPRTLSFASSAIGVVSASQAITVTNVGGLALNGLALQVVGSAASDFAIGLTNCTAGLGAGASCSLLVSFTPSVQGGRTAFLTASSTTAGVASESTSLSGIGLSAALLTTTPEQLTFSPTLVGQRSGTQPVTIVNAGQTGVTDLTVAVSAGFTLDAAHSTCTKVLAAGAGCKAGVIFAPMVAGTDAGTLVANSASADLGGSVAATTALNGVGALPAGVVTSPAGALAFGITGIHLSAMPMVVTVTNQGTISGLIGLSIMVDPAGTSAGFARSGGSCGVSLKAGASCTAIITFKPTQAGNARGTLSVQSANGANGASLALSGVGFDFTMALVGSGSVSVIPGQTAYYMIAITPLAGTSAALAGSFELGCTGLPANALCVFNPPLLAALPAGVSGDVTMGIGTGGPTISSGAVRDWGGGGPGPYKPGLSKARLGPSSTWNLLALLSLAMLPIRRARLGGAGIGRQSRKPWEAVLFVLMALPAILGVSSCVGASGSGGQLHGTGGTPIGSYTVQMTATSTGVAHSIPVTLVVN